MSKEKKSISASFIKIDLLYKELFHTDQKPLKNILTKSLLIWSFNRNCLDINKMIDLKVEFENKSMVKECSFSTINCQGCGLGKKTEVRNVVVNLMWLLDDFWV